MVGQNDYQQGTTNVVVINTNLSGEAICGHPIPHVNPCFALVILILNIFFPGLGTFITGIVGPGANCCAFLLFGILQLILTPVILIGWIWSICTGIAVLRVSNTPSVNVTTEQFIHR